MANKMLIDATHPEETRVAVVRGNRVEEFDYESASKRPLRGNIYLAKVIRVEPSLQAAFVEYGGNRHGFLAFSEIHPDYYQIPVADRERLIAEYARMATEDEDAEEEQARSRNNRSNQGRNRSRNRVRSSVGEQITADVAQSDDIEGEADAQTVVENEAEAHDTAPIAEAIESTDAPAQDDSHDDQPHQEAGDEHITESVESQIEQVNTNSDAFDEVPSRQIRRMTRQYKIQEVIKKRQVMLVQVVKEERGNKGAALTTYMSLAGRYAVLMPNTARGGGISRKIGSGEDRKRLKEVAEELEVPEGMGLIIRTAGAQRTKPEIKRDYDYLLRVWDSVRDLTLESTAPALVYEEGSLIKRSIRDLYGKEVDEIIVEGEDAYREAKDFMKMLMPSHSKNVQSYKENIPLFAKHGVESQLEVMFQNQVSLRSGGYLVINQTEALVAIDVNSGRSTKEHNIEDTALKTNLEAADEVARQLRLRDMAGLVVIDFIDMEDHRNNRIVERRLKDALQKDRARIQVGRISAFGLMEMSRQRLRSSVLESTTVQCSHCTGLGYVRSTASTSLLILRAVEAALIKDPRLGITVRTRTTNALYLLNHKRASLNDLEARYGMCVMIEADDRLEAGVHYAIDRTALQGDAAVAVAAAQQARIATLQAQGKEQNARGQSLFPEDEAEPEIDSDDEVMASPSSAEPTTATGDDEPRRKRRRRRRGRGRRDENTPLLQVGNESSEEYEDGDELDEGDEESQSESAAAPKAPLFATHTADNDVGESAHAPLLQASSAKPAFRRPRPPRPVREGEEGYAEYLEAQATYLEGFATNAAQKSDETVPTRRIRFTPNRPQAPAVEVEAPVVAVEAKPVLEVVEAPAKPARKPRQTAAQKAAAEAQAPAILAEPVVESAQPLPVGTVLSFEPSEAEQPQAPRKSGWWSRK